MVLRDRYETLFQIYNHSLEASDHPFALIMMNWNEDVVSHGTLYERMRQYIDMEIQKYFGLSFNEFIDQPTYVVMLQLEVAEARLRKEAPLHDAAREALDNLTKK